MESPPWMLSSPQRAATRMSSVSGRRVLTGQPGARRASSLGSASGTVSGSSSYPPTGSGRPSTRAGTAALSRTSGRKSRATSSIGARERHQVICAVSEARGVSPSIGIALVNISTGEAVLSQINDTQFYIKTIHKIQVFEPSKILLISSSWKHSDKSALLAVIEADIPDVPIFALDRRYWSESAGLDFIETLAFREDISSIKFALRGKFYATSAFSAAMKYLELEASVTIVSHSLRIRYQPSEDSMMIDLSTIRSLELIQNRLNSQSKQCLFGHLNHTITPMGARTLRSNLLQPSTMKDVTLTPRYDAVQELSTKEEMFFEVRTALKGFGDVEKLLTRLVVIPKEHNLIEAEQAVNNVLKIKSFMQAIPPLFLALATARSTLLERVRTLCRPEMTDAVLALISDTINDDVIYVDTPLDLRNQRTYAVKAGAHGLLDVARKTYKEATDDVHQHVQEINTELNLAGDLKFDDKRRYYIQFQVSDFEDASPPDILINCVRKKTWLQCQTMPLLMLNQRISDSVNEVVMQSDSVVKSLLDDIRCHVSPMFQVSEGVALVDMLASFAHIVTSRDYVRPDLGGTLALKDARHPILEAGSSDKFVPNDFYASAPHRFQIITGCNMSGKSTYIRTVALLQVMAQVGCFVPARYAAFPVVQNLFSRVSIDDDLEANLSGFTVEMREMAFILRNVDSRSLVIIDELGRATSTRDGLAIALAMAEALIQSGGMIFFTTHFIELAKVLTGRPGVLNLHMTTETTERDHDVEDNVPTLTMLYKTASGAVRETNYGIQFARTIRFPSGFLETAERAVSTLRESQAAKRRDSASRRLTARRKLVLCLHETLVQAEQSDMDDGALASFLRRLQADFITRMEALEVEVAADVDNDKGVSEVMESVEEDNGATSS